MKKVYRQLLSFLMAAAVLIGAGTIVNTKMSQASGDEKQRRQGRHHGGAFY